MVDWYAIIPVRDSEDSIGQAIESLLDQSVKPIAIHVINDGSTDETTEILESFGNKISVINTHSKTRDYKRIPKLLNMGLRHDADFHLIGAGDMTYEKDYAKKVLEQFEKDSKLVVASGDFEPYKSVAAHGAGRFVNQGFFFTYCKKYFEHVGFESSILFLALTNSFRTKIFNDVKMVHHEKYGGSHGFTEWGYSMKSLGYHPLFVLGRTVLAILKGDATGFKGSLNMLYRYLTFKEDGDWYVYADPKLRKGVSDYQKKYMKKKIMGALKIG